MLSLAAESACVKSPTVYIAVSNPLVWARTVPNTGICSEPRASASINSLGDHADTAQPQSYADIVDDAALVGCTDSIASQCEMSNMAELSANQFDRRLPAPCMESLYRAENAVLFQHSPEVLCTYVVCPGVLYGNGESSLGFHDLFAKAWQADATTALPVYGSGNNLIPTIHVDDCASFVLQLAQTQSDSRYLFATDDSQNSQATIVKAISAQFASGEIFDSDPLTLFTQQVSHSVAIVATHMCIAGCWV